MNGSAVKNPRLSTVVKNLKAQSKKLAATIRTQNCKLELFSRVLVKDRVSVAEAEVCGLLFTPLCNHATFISTAYRCWDIDTKQSNALTRIKFTRVLQDELVVAGGENQQMLAEAVTNERNKKLNFGVAETIVKFERPRQMCPDQTNASFATTTIRL